MAENKEAQAAAVKPSKKRLGHIIAFIAVFCLIVYSIFTIISQQAQIVQLKKQSSELSAQITEQEQKNDEFNRLLSTGDENEYMERVAVEQLGYAYPNERRFYIVEKND
ncbi:MAG: septum formation initiator family protein [Ruminococcus sp.]|nr:septum formation initiator family protein [Ruminococcus sp.]